MFWNTERAINHKEIVFIPEQHCTSKSYIYLISNVRIINLDITPQIKNMANKFVDSMANEVNYYKLVVSVPESSLKFRKFLSALPWNAWLSDDEVRTTSPNLACCKELSSVLT